MRKTKILLPGLLLLLISCQQQPKFEKPPLAYIAPVTETYFGKEITDPYRYMEDTKDTLALNWIKAQSVYARNILDNIPGRKALLDKMKELDKRKTVRVYKLAVTENDYYFYLKQTPEDETGKLFYRIGFTGKETLLVDPKTFSKDTTQKFVISNFYPSLKSSKIAFELAPNGSESGILYIMDVASGQIASENIDRVYFAEASWLPDEESFLYTRLQSSDVHNINREKDSKSYLHKVGTNPNEDVEIFSRTKNPELKILPEEFVRVYYDKTNKYLYAYIVTVNPCLKVYIAPLSELYNKKINWKLLFKQEDQIYGFEKTEKEIYAFTPKNAPNYKIIRIPIANPDINKAETIIPESKDEIITNFTLNSNGLYYTTSRNGVISKLYKNFIPIRISRK